MGYLEITRSLAFDPAPLFGDALQGEPYALDFSSNLERVANYATTDFDRFQEQVFAELKAADRLWALGAYLEDRSALLRDFPQMIDQGRVIHAGLDIVAPTADAPLFAPLTATVHATGVDAGMGNYGGYVVLRHDFESEHFFSFYGHLHSDFEVEAGQQLARSERFAKLGSYANSGHWFTHTHLQILTPRAVEADRILVGYVKQEDVPTLHEWFPTPYPMFRA